MDVVDQHFARLVEVVPQARLVRRGDGSAVVSVPDVRLPAGWNSATTTVHFVVPVGYPAARPDSFWAEDRLRLASGALPANAQMNANNPPMPGLLWFSFHPRTWNPLKDDLLTYFNVVRIRFGEVR